MTAYYFERFREELLRYAEGVHMVGAPAPAAAVEGLPSGLASFLRSWNGAELFIGAYEIFDAARLEREGDLLVVGRTSTGDRLALDLAAGGEPPVLRLEEDTGEVLVEGTSFARWIEGTLAADSVLYDREGDYKDRLFDDSGEELRPEVVAKRERKYLRGDPDAPGPAWRLARALERQGRRDEAAEILEAVVERAPSFAWAHYDFGRLLREAGDLPGAESAFVRAAEADLESEAAPFFLANAARAAGERGDEPARKAHAARALDLDPDLARAQKDAARARLAEDAPSDARELLTLAAALTPTDLDLLSLLRSL